MRYTIPAAEAYIDCPIAVLDHGFVMLKDYMGSDAAIAEAARVSMAGEGTKKISDDEALIRYLFSHAHTSPFEMVEMKFHCAMPIFVARQWIRHRTANVNEMSGRFSQLPELVYVPDEEQIAFQNPGNKQGRGGGVPREIAARFRAVLTEDASTAFRFYRECLGKPGDANWCSRYSEEEFAEIVENGGISRELARINLPLSTYTQWYWKIDLHNLFHFLALRLDEHAQWEIRSYAKEMAKMVEALCPIAWQAFVDYRLDSLRLSGPDLEAIGYLVDQFHCGLSSTACLDRSKFRLSAREVEELRVKMQKVGFGFLNNFKVSHP